jgi:DNA-binding transcriptional MerR regulator
MVSASAPIETASPKLSSDTTRLLTLTELASYAESITGSAGITASSGRVHSTPDERMIRFYTTRGLIDKPTRSPDRTARYGSRQLAQVLAVKRLQSRGQSLDSIVASLHNLSTTELLAIADLPPGSMPADLASGSQDPKRSQRDFWSTTPTKQPPSPQIASVSKETLPQTQLAVVVSKDLTLLITTSSPPDAQLTTALAAQAAPLVALLSNQLSTNTPTPESK